MKIGPKIALFYSLITMCAIIMVMSVFYLFSSRYINRLYESYLREKAFITAQKYWEKDIEFGGILESNQYSFMVCRPYAQWFYKLVFRCFLNTLCTDLWNFSDRKWRRLSLSTPFRDNTKCNLYGRVHLLWEPRLFCRRALPDYPKDK